jgi:ELWxxDGT repeat protein
MYLNASTADKGYELWKTNGTAAGTVLVKDIEPGLETVTGFSYQCKWNVVFSLYTITSFGNRRNH